MPLSITTTCTYEPTLIIGNCHSHQQINTSIPKTVFRISITSLHLCQTFNEDRLTVYDEFDDSSDAFVSKQMHRSNALN